MKDGIAVKPVAPGEMLEEKFMKPPGLSKAEFAHRLDVPPTGSPRSLRAAAPSHRKQPCDWRRCSDGPQPTGSGTGLSMTWSKPARRTAPASASRCARWRLAPGKRSGAPLIQHVAHGAEQLMGRVGFLNNPRPTLREKFIIHGIRRIAGTKQHPDIRPDFPDLL